MKKFIYTKDQNNVWMPDTDKTYIFKRGRKACTKCDLYSDCINLYTEETPFPFPCTERIDKNTGVFIDSDKIIQNRAFAIAMLSVAAIVGGILVYFELIPNFIEKLIYAIWA